MATRLTGSNLRNAALLLAIALELMAATLLHAQSMGTGTIQGTVSDPSGAPVGGANVTALEKSRGTQRTTQTDSAGGYVFANMSIGDYEISVESAGFKRLLQEAVRVITDSTTTVNAALQLGTAQESVTVSAAPPPLQTENGELGNLISGAQVSELSLNGRNFSQFLTLSPGVTSSQTGRRMGVGQEGNPLMSINGGRVNSTRFTYDGVLAMDTGGNRGLNLFPPMDAIAEVQVKTSNFAASEGSFGYGLVNVVTKSGGSHFHGDLYEFLATPISPHATSSIRGERRFTRICSGSRWVGRSTFRMVTTRTRTRTRRFSSSRKGGTAGRVRS